MPYYQHERQYRASTLKRLDKIWSKVLSRAFMHWIYFDKNKSEIERIQIYIIFIILINQIFPDGIFVLQSFKSYLLLEKELLHENRIY